MKRRFSQLMYLLITCTLVFGQPAIASSPHLPTVLRPSSAVRSAGTFESPLPQPPPTPPAEPPAESQDCAAEASDDAVLRVSFAAAEARPGQEARLAWTVFNCRPLAVEGIELGFGIPQSFTLSPQDVPAPLSYNPNTRTVSGGLPSLAAGATLTAQFPLRVTGLRAGVPMTVTKHYSFGGQRIAMCQGQGPFTCLHADHLGSTLAATDSNGTVLGGNQPRYYAYGAERQPSIASLPTSFTYTGQRSDVGTGLMYYGARYYDSRLGTFIQPDTMVSQPSNPQSLNRYAYGLGSPVKYRDPTGHWVETAFDVVSTGFDIAAVKQDPSFLNIGALIVDAGAAILPFVPSGAGWLARGGKAAVEVASHADDVVDAVKLLSHGDEALDAVRAAEGVAEAGAKGARKIAGLLPAPKLQNHHIFPQHWKDWFRAPGRNIDIDKFTVELSEKTHLSGVHGKGGFVAVDDIELSGRWNARWEEFISKNPNATAKEVYQFAGGLMDEFGLSGLDIVAYPK